MSVALAEAKVDSAYALMDTFVMIQTSRDNWGSVRAVVIIIVIALLYSLESRAVCLHSFCD